MYDIFVDEDETSFVTVRRFLRPDAVLAPRYQVSSLLANGTYIETSPREARSRGRALLGRTGSGDLVRDALEHVAFVRDRASRGQRVVRIAALSDVLRLHVFYMGHVIDADGARSVADIGEHLRALVPGPMSVVSLGLLAILFYVLFWQR